VRDGLTSITQTELGFSRINMSGQPSQGARVWDPLGFDRSRLRPELQTDEAYIRIGEINSLMFSMLGPNTHTQFMEFPTLLAAHPDSPPIAEAMLDSFKRILMQIMVAHAANQAAIPVPAMSTAEMNAQRKACLEKICRLKRGECILTWTKEAREVINHVTISLPEDEKLSVVKKQSKEGDPTVSHLIDNHETCKRAVTAEEYLVALEKLFEAQDIQCQTALSNFKQPSNMKAKDYAAEVEKIVKTCWAKLPYGITQIMGLISNMSEKHKPFMMAQIDGLNNVKAYGTLKDTIPITYTTFLTWCDQSDARYSRNQERLQAKTNNVQGGNGRDPKNRNNNSGNTNQQSSNQQGNNNRGQHFQKRDKFDFRNDRNFPQANFLQVDASTPERRPVLLSAGSPCIPESLPVQGVPKEFQKFVISSPKSERFLPVTHGVEETFSLSEVGVRERLIDSMSPDGGKPVTLHAEIHPGTADHELPPLMALEADESEDEEEPVYVNMMFAAPPPAAPLDREQPPQHPPQVEDFAPVRMAFEDNEENEKELLVLASMMEALEEEETIIQLIDVEEPEGIVNAAGHRPARNRPHNAEPYRKEDNHDYRQDGSFYLPAHARPEVRLAGAVFTSSLAGLVMLWKNPNTPNLISALAKMLNMKDPEVIQGAKEAVQSVAVAAKQLQASISPEAGYVGFPYRKFTPTPMEMICPHAIGENYAPVIGAVELANKIFHKTASMPAFQFSFLESTDERIGHLDTGCNINIVSYKAMMRDKGKYGENCKISKVRPFTVQFADGRTTSAAFYAVEEAIVVVGAAKYEVDFIVMENLSTEYLFGFPWFTTYDVQTLPFRSHMSIGICKEDFLGKDEDYQPYQEIGIRFNVKALTLYPRN
jgi:hypothetical protein